MAPLAPRIFSEAEMEKRREMITVRINAARVLNRGHNKESDKDEQAIEEPDIDFFDTDTDDEIEPLEMRVNVARLLVQGYEAILAMAEAEAKAMRNEDVKESDKDEQATERIEELHTDFFIIDEAQAQAQLAKAALDIDSLKDKAESSSEEDGKTTKAHTEPTKKESTSIDDFRYESNEEEKEIPKEKSSNVGYLTMLYRWLWNKF